MWQHRLFHRDNANKNSADKWPSYPGFWKIKSLMHFSPEVGGSLHVAEMNSTTNGAVCPPFMPEQRAACLWHKEGKMIWDPFTPRTLRLWLGTESRQASSAILDIVVHENDSSWLLPHNSITHPSPALRCLCLVGSSIQTFLLWGMPVSLSCIYNSHISSHPSPTMKAFHAQCHSQGQPACCLQAWQNYASKGHL